MLSGGYYEVHMCTIASFAMQACEEVPVIPVYFSPVSVHALDCSLGGIIMYSHESKFS